MLSFLVARVALESTAITAWLRVSAALLPAMLPLLYFLGLTVDRRRYE
jgi:hypothetical protein